MNTIKVLDHGFVRFVEAWGHGDAGDDYNELTDNVMYDYECGIIEAARQSTQGSFRGWDDQKCSKCSGNKWIPWPDEPMKGMVCPECEGKGVIRGDEKLLKFLHENKHATPFEFSGMVIEVRAPIFVFREWHRHRTQSYNEMSARYAPLPNENYVPDWENLKERGEASSNNRQANGTEPWNELMAHQWHKRLPEVYEYLQKVYNDALIAGVPKELARIILPVGRYSQMRASTCLRNWLAFLTLRMSPQAQFEIREYANAVGQLIAQHFPRTWKLFNLSRE